MGERLSAPPPARLAVPPPDKAYLSEPAATRLAEMIAMGLVALEVPATSIQPHKRDWRLMIAVELRAGMMVPRYRVLDPNGQEKGNVEGTPVLPSEWTGAAPAALRRVADEAVPRVAAMLSRIEAARRQSDPNSLVNRAPRVIFTGVVGAPGDGNEALSLNMRAELVKAGQSLFEPPAAADFKVAGEVKLVVTGPDKQRVEIQWIVTDAKGEEAGRVLQLNEVRRGMLDAYWGDVAFVVAHEAASGVRDVITNRIGPKQSQ